MNSSKCNIASTPDKYKKGRTVHKLCYNNHVLAYHKNIFCSNSSPKSKVSTQTDFSDKQDGSNKEDSSVKQDVLSKQVRCRKQDSSNKQVRCSEKDISNKQTRSSEQ